MNAYRRVVMVTTGKQLNVKVSYGTPIKSRPTWYTIQSLKEMFCQLKPDTDIYLLKILFLSFYFLIEDFFFNFSFCT